MITKALFNTQGFFIFSDQQLDFTRFVYMNINLPSIFKIYFQ
jgi:hypothetical protein